MTHGNLRRCLIDHGILRDKKVDQLMMVLLDIHTHKKKSVVGEQKAHVKHCVGKSQFLTLFSDTELIEGESISLGRNLL